MPDFALQRKNMVESQVRPSDVTDRRILRAMLEVPREQFVPASLRPIAYMDEHLALAGTGGATRQMLAPRTFAKLVQLLDVDQGSVVLDVGSGTGYSAAILARLAGKVVALEADAALAEQARKVLSEQGIGNVVVKQGSLADGAKAEAPFDAILLNGAVPEAPTALLAQLKDGGCLAVIVASGPRSQAVVWRRIGNAYDGRAAFDAAAAILPGFERKAEFAL